MYPKGCDFVPQEVTLHPWHGTLYTLRQCDFAPQGRGKGHFAPKGSLCVLGLGGDHFISQMGSL